MPGCTSLKLRLLWKEIYSGSKRSHKMEGLQKGARMLEVLSQVLSLCLIIMKFGVISALHLGFHWESDKILFQFVSHKH